ncbi:hypothetical protein RIEPE_0059 [Candidatus Riesia pediculicola USDA]|uniref:Uncharacterized protein n=1 Tax=Riesia pediculicola (strain USDA) TaxID=515618 RepID=D4G7M3_RIEPU|nr:hypothetical protein RIEPE_0059 [Candidatus Riesia pediculicola USDA]
MILIFYFQFENFFNDKRNYFLSDSLKESSINPISTRNIKQK